MTDAKKKKQLVVNVDDLTVGGICNGLKKGAPIGEAVEFLLKKKTTRLVDKNKKATDVPIYDVLLKNKTIKLVDVEPAEETTESAK